MVEEGGRRPKRRCASRNVHTSAMPSATHYVGYVEDDETPEMIMAKFQELERIEKAVQEAKKVQAATATTENGGEAAPDAATDNPTAAENAGTTGQALTDEQLLEVFKQTSMFNVKTALQDNAMLMGIDEMLEHNAERYGYDEDLDDDDDFLKSFWSDDEDAYMDSDGSGDEFSGRKGRRRGSGGSRRTGGGGRLQRNAGGVRARHNIVTAYNPDTQALVRRKVRVADTDEIVQIRVPPAPIPLPWGRTVRPYLPAELRGEKKEAVPTVPTPEQPPASNYIEVGSLVNLDTKALPKPTYQAVLINPGWERDGTGAAALSALSRVPLPKLVPAGFVFIWTPKQHVQAVCKQMSKWGYIYIENLTWVYVSHNNSVLQLQSEFVRNSHMTLYMFRMADKGRDIELRHQRNPDVTFECVAASTNAGEVSIPHETFVAVETLLPTGKGQLLELWAPQGVKRPGWTHVVEVGANES